MTTVLPMAFTAPTITWAPMLPVVVVLGAAVLGVLVEAFLPPARRRTVQVVLACVALAGAVVAIAAQWGDVTSTGGTDVLGGSLLVDGPTLVLQGTIVVLTLLSVLVMADRTSAGEDAFAPVVAAVPGSDYERLAADKGLAQTEVYPLVMFASGGMMIFPATGDLLTLFVALEVLSLPLYLLTGAARRRRLFSQEASMKYFLLGAFASALLIFGIALLYGYSGSLSYTDLAHAIAEVKGDDTLVLVGAVLVLAGLLFKTGAVPFHLWTPDVYQGAPTPITGFMAACTKVAAFGALLRFVYVALRGLGWELSILLWIVAIATMLVGTGAALVQNDVKRLLAYSSIAHAGFVLTGVVALNQRGVVAVLFYLLAYGATTVGAFAIVSMVRERSASGGVTGEATALSQWAGLGRTNPALAWTFTLFLLSFAGIPLTAGFVGKFTAFAAAVDGGAWPLAVVGVLASAAAAFFYVKIVVLMFFTDAPVTEEPGDALMARTAVEAGADVLVAQAPASAPARLAPATVVRSSGPLVVVIVVSALLTVGLGVFPGPVLHAIGSVAQFLP